MLLCAAKKSRFQFAFQCKDESRFRRQELSARIKESIDGKFAS